MAWRTDLAQFHNLLARPVIGRNSRSTPVRSMLKVHHGSEETFLRKESLYRQSILCASHSVSRIVTAYCEWDRAYSVQATGLYCFI